MPQTRLNLSLVVFQLGLWFIYHNNIKLSGGNPVIFEMINNHLMDSVINALKEAGYN